MGFGGQIFADAWQGASDAARQGASALAQGAHWVGEKTAAAATYLKDKAVDLGQWSAKTATAAWNTTRDAAQGAWKATKEKASELYKKGVAAVKATARKVKAVVSRVACALKEGLRKAREASRPKIFGAGKKRLDVVKMSKTKLKVGRSIVIEGDEKFQKAVIRRLEQISAHPAGRRTLSTIDGSGRHMRITAFPGSDNSDCGPANAQGFADATRAGQPVWYGDGKTPVLDPAGKQMTGTGKGADVEVRILLSLTLPNSLSPGNPAPNDAVLFHEMTHGAHQMTGRYDGTPMPGWTTAEERNTILTHSPSEADYLRQSGYGYHRTDHDTTWAANPSH